MHTFWRKLFGEVLGTALLLTVVIGSGVMAERLSGGNMAMALLANALATVGGLCILIEVFGPVSGAHFNPAVSSVMAWRGELPRGLWLPYVLAQLLGAIHGDIETGRLEMLRPARHAPCTLPFDVWMALAKASPVSRPLERSQAELADTEDEAPTPHADPE